VTALEGRSAATLGRCREAGIEVVRSLAEVARESDVVISVVPPAAAMEVVERYAELAHFAPAAAVYVDANSISPDMARMMAEKIKGCGRGFVDASINGLAKNLETAGTLFLSGARAGEIAGMFEGAMRVQNLGDKLGGASAMKMLLSGVSKGVCALFVELAMLAQRQEMLPEMNDAMARIYPGIWALVERMLPTYVQHAGRRATEMGELEQTIRAAGLKPEVIAGVCGLHEILAGVSWGKASEARGWTAADLVRELASKQLLTAEALATEETDTGVR
jgi:putative dehydrogenase